MPRRLRSIDSEPFTARELDRIARSLGRDGEASWMGVWPYADTRRRRPSGVKHALELGRRDGWFETRDRADGVKLYRLSPWAQERLLESSKEA